MVFKTVSYSGKAFKNKTIVEYYLKTEGGECLFSKRDY